MGLIGGCTEFCKRGILYLIGRQGKPRSGTCANFLLHHLYSPRVASPTTSESLGGLKWGILQASLLLKVNLSSFKERTYFYWKQLCVRIQGIYTCMHIAGPALYSCIIMFLYTGYSFSLGIALKVPSTKKLI